jgi:hypothetical protein
VIELSDPAPLFVLSVCANAELQTTRPAMDETSLMDIFIVADLLRFCVFPLQNLNLDIEVVGKVLPDEFEGYVAHDTALFELAYDSHVANASRRT